MKITNEIRSAALREVTSLSSFLDALGVKHDKTLLSDQSCKVLADEEAEKLKIKLKAAAYYQANKERIKAKVKKYKEEHREQVRASDKHYREKNREKRRAWAKAYYARKKLEAQQAQEAQVTDAVG